MNEYLSISKVFKALGDPKRTMIVNMLSDGEICACRILEKFELSQSTLSHHMKTLCQCGIVKAREAGKWTYYSLNEEVIYNVIQSLRNITKISETCNCNDDLRFSEICNESK